MTVDKTNTHSRPAQQHQADDGKGQKAERRAPFSNNHKKVDLNFFLLCANDSAYSHIVEKNLLIPALFLAFLSVKWVGSYSFLKE